MGYMSAHEVSQSSRLTLYLCEHRRSLDRLPIQALHTALALEIQEQICLLKHTKVNSWVKRKVGLFYLWLGGLDQRRDDRQHS